MRKEHNETNTTTLASPSQQPLAQNFDLPARRGDQNLGFDVAERYRPLRSIGAGAYGAVCCALDLQTGEYVAIKKIASVFNDLKEARRAAREVQLLRHFKGYENILQIKDLFFGATENASTFNDLYIVTELLETGDANAFCQNKDEREALLSNEKKLAGFMYSLLRGLFTLHAAGVLHRDLRPKNLLINHDKLTICDLGAGRAQQASTAEMRMSLLAYVSSLYYTAPEALLPNTNYTSAVDVWAAGCVMAEFITGIPLFRHPSSYISNVDQLLFISDIVGYELDEAAICNFNSEERFRAMLRKVSPKASTLDERLKNYSLSKEAMDLLQRLLTLDPLKRITAAEALNHPWFDAMHDAEPPIVHIFHGEAIELAETKEDLRELLLLEMSADSFRVKTLSCS